MIKKAILTLLLLLSVATASAQYFVSEKDPVTYKWRQIERKGAGSVIYPDFLKDRAAIVANIADTIRPYITYGLYDLVGKFPITLHPSNILSNGMVTLTPKRMELNTALPVNTFAVPWLTQLTIHESRHVVQLSNLNQGFTKGASYILGEQAAGIVTIVLPTYFFEGDAVAAETEMTMYGRGLQPEFSITYRAMMNEDLKELNIAKLMLGSYKDQMPSSYELGYQITQFGREYYGDNFWENIVNYVARRSYTIFSYYFGLKKYTGSGSSSLIENSFADLKKFWHNTSQVENSTTITPNNTKYYTTYSNPLVISAHKVIALKESMQEATKFVIINPEDGEESTFKHVGHITSRPEKVGNKVMWTEYRPSMSYGNKNKSEIRYLEIENIKRKISSMRPRSVKTIKSDVYYITDIGGDRYAMVSFDKENRGSLLITDTLFHEKLCVPLPDPYTSFNGLAWDNETNTLASIILDKEGMYLASLSLEDGSITRLTEPSYVTRSNLRAGGGKLYFNSIASGKDEAHSFDLKSRVELQLTTSKYGSSSPTPVSNSQILLSTYTRLGYRLASQKIDSSTVKEVTQTKLPQNIVNYPFRSWGLPKIDTMNIISPDASTVKSKKYNKAAHLFRVHSWLPIYLDIDKLLNERIVNIGLGATAISQNTLNTMVATASVGYVPHGGGFITSGSFSYRELPVNINLNVEYGGGKQLNDSQGLDKGNKEYLGTTLGVSLPLNLSSGNKNRFFSAAMSYNYNNTVYAKPNDTGNHDVITGVHKLNSSISFQSTMRKATNDLTPRFGYFASLNSAFNPTNVEFGKLYSVYCGLYLPGIFLNNSVTLMMAYQYQKPEKNNFHQAILFPRGVTPKDKMEHQGAVALSYKAPLLYPDFDCLWSNLYIKRLWIDFFGEMAQYKIIGSKERESAYTYGLTLHVNLNVFCISNDIDIALSLFKPSDNKNPIFNVGFGVAF